MLVPGNLGFPGLVLVFLFFYPVIGFVIRQKWRIAVARRKEIMKLVVLASEEAARAELEATVEYGGTVSISWQFQCVVCYCPTTTRCSRCKAVRYCSGKCQIIHWKQGHKEECHLPSATIQFNGEGSDSGPNAELQEQFEIYGNSFAIEGKLCAKPKVFPEEPALSKSSHPPEDPCWKDDDDKVEPLVDGKGTDTISESSSTSLLAGLSASATTSKPLVDVSSVSEILCSGTHDRSEGSLSDDISPDILEIRAEINGMELTKSPSSESTSLVDSVKSFSCLSKLDQMKPSCSDGEVYCRSTNPSGSSINGSDECSISEPSTASPALWEGTLKSSVSRHDVHADPDHSNSSESGDGILYISGSALRFSFNLSGHKIPPLHSGCSVAKTVMSDSGHSTSLENKKPTTDGASLSGKVVTDASKIWISPSLRSERSDSMANERSNCSQLLKAKEIRPLSSTASDDYPSSISVGHLVPSVKSAKVVNVHAVPTISCTVPTISCAVPTISSKAASSSPNATKGLKTSVQKIVQQLRASKPSKHYLLGLGREISGRYNYKMIFPYELFIKLCNWDKMELRPCGLMNCGNSFMFALAHVSTYIRSRATGLRTRFILINASIHKRSKGSIWGIDKSPTTIAMDPTTAFAVTLMLCSSAWHLLHLLLHIFFKHSIPKHARPKKDLCFTCELEGLILKAKEGKSPLSPVSILSQIQNVGSHLGHGREEDAHEFLRYAIDTMQSVCLKEAEVNTAGLLAEETTLIGLIFGGYLRSEIKCMKCRGKSKQHERMLDLTVEIQGHIETLEEALEQFTATEILDGENKYQCSRCKSYEKAKKKLTILEAPNVLTIALKRFRSGKFGKLSKSVQYPEILNLAPYMSGTGEKSHLYRLYAVVVHLDIMNAAFSGHYICYVKNIQGKWFKIDDSTVKPVEIERVLSEGAYMLLYSRCSPRAPGLIRKTLVSHDEKTKNRYSEAVPSSLSGKDTKFKGRPNSMVPSFSRSMAHQRPEDYPYWMTPDGLISIEPFDSDNRRFHPMHQIPLVDSSSDSSSLFSCSDEGSCSTESNRGSTSTEDFSDYIFGEAGRYWSSPWRISSDSDASSSPLFSRSPGLALSDRNSSGSPETSGSRTYNAESAEVDGVWMRLPPGNSRREDLEGKGSSSSLISGTTKHCRNLINRSRSSSNSRETNSEILGWLNPLNVKSGVSFGRSTRERNNQTLY
ncbi:hypothetical protein HHK36_030730 [Tetracentron sinense]|uniref:Uncharacterized protein n=1 Tax=Tetracentron sinense TaxID=13715 RepID=A0A835D1U0_TETSI|nr:hypothetical protein HHK36_030730 [Tetracentron sinense]